MTISRGIRRLLRWLMALAMFLVIILLFLFYYHNSVTDHVDTYVYELPYAKGSSCRVVQGYGGLFSHSHTAALDFAMPVGTTVYAARGGVVFSYKDDSDEGGMTSRYKDKANYIIIRHDDGSFGCYWHLKKDGVLIKKGKVEKGNPIALSGATGLVVSPHLHFSVKRRLSYEMNSFVQTKFRTTEGVVILKNRSLYKRPLD